MATPPSNVDGRAPSTSAPFAAWSAPAVVAPVALAVVAGIALASGAGAAMGRPLWLDEVVTQLVANAPRGILHAMRSGVDFQPPAHYALVRLADTLAGAPSPAATRMPSLLAAALAVLVLAATLRRTLSVAATLAGALALAAHPLFTAQAFEARPYALWILATAVTAKALRATRASRAPLAAAGAIALCTVHYFGILSLAAIAAGLVAHRLLARRTTWRAAVKAAAPLAAGVVAFGLLLPLARAQLAATGGRSWVPPVTASGVSEFLRFPWGWRPALLLIAAGLVMLAARRVPWLAARLPRPDHATADATIAALVATAAVPLLVVLVSVTYKPVMVLRYSAPAVLAVAALCALAVEQMPRIVRWVAVAFLVRAALFSYHSVAVGARDDTTRFAAESSAVQALAARGVATVSPFRHDAYRATLGTPGGPGVAWLDLPDALLDRAASAVSGLLNRNMLLLERDFGRAAQREFGFPAVRSIDDARSAPAVALLRDAALAGLDTLWLPARAACPLSARLVVYARPDAAVSCATLQAAVQDGPSRR